MLQAFLGRLFDQTLDEIILFDATSLRYLDANRAALDNLGYSSAELQALLPLALTPEYGPDQARAEVLAPLAAGTVDSVLMETSFQRKDGSYYPVSLRMLYVADDRAPLFVAICHSEARAVAAEALLASVIDKTGTGLAEVDSEGLLISCNQTYAGLIGVESPSELVGRNILDWHAPERLAVAQAALARFPSEGRLEDDYETIYLKPDGERVFVNVGATRVEDVDGQSRLFAIVRDISASKRAEEQLRRSEALTREVLNTTGTGLITVDRSGVILSASRAFVALTPFDSETPLLGRSVLDLVEPEALSSARAAFDAMLVDGERVRDFDTRFRSDDGGVDVRIQAIHSGQAAAEGGFAALCRNVTGEKGVLRELAESEALLRRAQRIGRIGHWRVDPDTAQITGSDELFRLIEWSPNDSLNLEHYLHTRVSEPDRAPFRNYLLELQQQSGEVAMEYSLELPSGEQRRVEVVAEAETNGQLVGILRERTEQWLVEEERTRMERKMVETQKLESLGVLAGGIAHDFNNLLTSMLGHASLARMKVPVDSDMVHNLQQIETAAINAADLCNQMLAYSGQGQFVLEPVNVSGLIEDTLQLLQLSISKKAVLQLDLSDDLPTIMGDMTQLRQVLMNLVVNASDAIGDRSGVIGVRTGWGRATTDYLMDTAISGGELSPGDYFYVEVSDNGCGMDAETLERIFDPFFTTKFTGRGLGLAAAHGIMRAHNGAIRAYSEVGRGSTMRLLLPLPEGVVELPLPTAEKDPDWQGSGCILVVDDEPAVSTVAALMLESFGFETEIASDGAIGVEKYRASPARYCGVVMDLTMPKMDGAEAVSKLREIDPAVKVLLMSGFSEQEAAERFADEGLAGFIQKPFEMDLLRTSIRQMLEGRDGL